MSAERAEEMEEEGIEPFSPSSSARTAASEPEPVESAPSRSSPSVPVMTGTHFHSLDEKGRVIIPAKLRPALTEQFWMMLDENDNIGIYNYSTGMDILEHCERMIAEHPEDEDIAAAVERITGAADLVTAESAFRVPVPDILQYYAGLDKEVVTVGVLNHAVMWSREKWEESRGTRMQSPEVRKAQASMLRAAASGLKRKAAGGAESRELPEAIESAPEQAVERGAEDGGRDERGTERAAGAGGGGRKAASSGDGGRSPRVLALSQLGR